MNTEGKKSSGTSKTGARGENVDGVDAGSLRTCRKGRKRKQKAAPVCVCVCVSLLTVMRPLLKRRRSGCPQKRAPPGRIGSFRREPRLRSKCGATPDNVSLRVNTRTGDTCAADVKESNVLVQLLARKRKNHIFKQTREVCSPPRAEINQSAAPTHELG